MGNDASRSQPVTAQTSLANAGSEPAGAILPTEADTQQAPDEGGYCSLGDDECLCIFDRSSSRCERWIKTDRQQALDECRRAVDALAGAFDENDAWACGYDKGLFDATVEIEKLGGRWSAKALGPSGGAHDASTMANSGRDQ